MLTLKSFTSLMVYPGLSDTEMVAPWPPKQHDDSYEWHSRIIHSFLSTELIMKSYWYYTYSCRCVLLSTIVEVYFPRIVDKSMTQFFFSKTTKTCIMLVFCAQALAQQIIIDISVWIVNYETENLSQLPSSVPLKGGSFNIGAVREISNNEARKK